VWFNHCMIQAVLSCFVASHAQPEVGETRSDNINICRIFHTLWRAYTNESILRRNPNDIARVQTLSNIWGTLITFIHLATENTPESIEWNNTPSKYTNPESERSRANEIQPGQPSPLADNPATLPTTRLEIGAIRRPVSSSDRSRLVRNHGQEGRKWW